MRIIHNIPAIFVISFWGLMMGFLVKKEFLAENISAQKIRFPKELPYMGEWGIYDKTDRIGYLKTKFFLLPKRYVWKNRAEIRLLPENTFSVNGTALFNKNRGLRDFYMNLAYQDLTVGITGILKKNILKLKVKTNGRITDYALPCFADADVVNNGIIPWFYISGLKIGNRFNWYIVNPLDKTKDLVKAVVKRESFYYTRISPDVASGRGKENFVPVMVVDMYYRDIKLEFWVDNAGNPLKVVTPWGWRLETE